MNHAKPDMSKGAITARLRAVSAMSDLSPERRLEGKIDMSPQAITARLREVAELLQLCRALGSR
jgi:hypothetical protein